MGLGSHGHVLNEVRYDSFVQLVFTSFEPLPSPLNFSLLGVVRWTVHVRTAMWEKVGGGGSEVVCIGEKQYMILCFTPRQNQAGRKKATTTKITNKNN